MSRHKPAYVSTVMLLLVAVLGTALVACPTTPVPTSPTTAPAAASPTQQADVAAPTPATPAPALVTPAPAAAPASTTGALTGQLARDQVLRVNLAIEPPTLDPSRAQDSASLAVLTAMYEGLTRFRPDLTVEPAIAQSWDVSADGKTFTFKLRDARWSDGTPLTAKDFEYSWKRMLHPDTASPYAFVLADVVAGADEFNSAAVPTDTAKLPQLEAAVGAKAIDDQTFQVTLLRPASHFLFLTALWNTVPLNRAAIEKGGDKWTEPATHVANGPFALKTWEHQSLITLEPNPNYWDTKPTLTRLEMHMITSEKANLEAYKNNELDITFGIPLAEIPAVRADPVLSKEIVQGTTTGTYFIGFNNAKEPFTGEKGKLVRQAFSQAIDRKTIAEVITHGVNVPAKSFLPPGMFGYQPNIGFEYDPAKARQTLDSAGYKDGSELGKLTLLYNSPPVPGHKPVMEFVAKQLNDNLGVEVEFEVLEPGAWLDLLEKDPPQMFRYGYSADYPHPDGFLNVWFNSRSAQNYAKYSNPQFDRLVEQASAEVDQAKQLALYNQAQQILVDDAPVIFVYYYGRFRLVKPWVKDLYVTTQDPATIGAYFYRLTKIAER